MKRASLKQSSQRRPLRLSTIKEPRLA